MKRSLFTRVAVGAVALASAITLTACGSSSSDSSNSSTPASLGPASLEISYWGDATRTKLFNQVIDGFEAKYPQIKVKGTPVGAPTDLFNRLNTDFGSGGTTAPDVFALGGSQPQTYGANGNLLDLSTVSGIVQLDQYPKASLVSSTVDNKVYGLPTGGNATAMFINKDIFKQAGVAIPDKWTWDTFTQVANEIGSKHLTTSSGKPIYGVDLRIGDIEGTYLGQQTQYGLYTPDGGIGVSQDNVADWYKIELGLKDGGGLSDPSTVTSGWNLPPDQQLYTLGQAAITFGYSNLLSSYSAGGDTAIVQPPTNGSDSGVALLPSAFWAINAKTKYPEQSATLMNYFLSDPSALKLISDTRGDPFLPSASNIVVPALTGASKTAADYVSEASKNGKVAPPQPNGGQNQQTYAENGESDVLFGRASPEDAAATFIKKLQNDINAAK